MLPNSVRLRQQESEIPPATTCRIARPAGAKLQAPQAQKTVAVEIPPPLFFGSPLR